MTVFANDHSINMSTLFAYKNKINYYKNMFEKAYQYFKTPNYLDKKLIDIKDQFPKFPTEFNIISSLDSVNLYAINECTMNNIEFLLDILMGTSIISLKPKYDKIPSSVEDILIQYYYQMSYLTKTSNHYDFDNLTKSYLVENQEYYNHFGNLFGSYFDGSSGKLKDFSFIINYSTYCMIHNYLYSYCDFFAALSDYTQQAEIQNSENSTLFTKYKLKESFSMFINYYKYTISNETSKIISKIIFQFDSLGPKLDQDLRLLVEKRICNSTINIKTIFKDFINKPNIANPSIIICSNIVDSLYASISSNITSHIFNSDKIIPILNDILDLDIDIVNELTDVNSLDSVKLTSSPILNSIIYENNKFKEYFNKMTEMNLQSYLFLVFLYKQNPEKFLNVLQLVIKDYVENVIKTSSINDDFIKINENNDTNNRDLQHIISSYITKDSNENNNTINYKELAKYINENFTLFKIKKHLADNKIVEFSCKMYYLDLINQFVESLEFKKYIKTILYDVYIYLRNNGHISHDFNWYQKYETIHIYIKSFLQQKIFNQSIILLSNSNKEASFIFGNKDDNINYSSNLYVTCIDKDSYDSVTIYKSFIYAKNDDITCARQVIEKIVMYDESKFRYILKLNSPYLGNEINKETAAYEYINSVENSTLFNDATKNMENICSTVLSESYITLNTADVEGNEIYENFMNLSEYGAMVNMHKVIENHVLSSMTKQIILSIFSNYL